MFSNVQQPVANCVCLPAIRCCADSAQWVFRASSLETAAEKTNTESGDSETDEVVGKYENYHKFLLFFSTCRGKIDNSGGKHS